MLLQGGTDLPAPLASERARGAIDVQPDDHRPAMPGAADVGAADAARAALRMFMAGFGIGADERCDRLVERLLPGACARRRDDSQKSLGECAILHAEQAFETWLSFVLGAERLAGQPALPIGRAAFLACDGPTAWPDLILVDDALPEPFVAAMRAVAPSLAPMPTPGAMATQSLESWSIADAGRAVVEVLETNAWLTHARPLITVPIRLTRQNP
ncbi:MAG: hypothetical protein ACREJ0_21825 [Geminicoccaceae bacterium]